jgi:hypothetical protein
MVTNTPTYCTRCGQPARGGAGSPEARILRRARTGVCIECGIVEFLQRLDNMSGPSPLHKGGLLPAGANWAEALRLPHVREQLAAVLRAGHADATPEEIDWQRVIAVWNVAPKVKGTLF